MPIISNITSQNTSLNSTMDLVVNQGSTTVRMTAAQVVAGMGPDASTAAVGALVYLKSTVDTTVLAAPTNSSGSLLYFSSGSAAPAWLEISSGEIVYGTSAGGGIPTALAAPSAGGILQFSTVDGSIGPRWLDMSSGSLIRGSSIDGNPLELVVGTDGQILESSGSTLHWVTRSDITTLADPTSESLLWHRGGSSAGQWVSFDINELVRFSTLGVLEAVPAPSSGAVLVYTTATGSSAAAWKTLSTGSILFGSSDGSVAELTQPSAGAIMRYSTVNGTSGPEWFDLTSGQFIIGSSVEGNPIAFAVPSSGAILTHSTVNGTFGPAWLDVSTGELVTRSSDGTMKSLAIPSSDSILQFSTVDGSIGPIWLTPGDGEVLISDADGDLDFLVAGSSEQILQITGAVPAWQNRPTSGHITTVGTSGQYLQTTGGAAAWVGISSHALLTGDASQKTTHVAAPGTSGAILRTGATSIMEWVSPGSSGQQLTIIDGLPAWGAAGGGGGNTTEVWSLRHNTTFALSTATLLAIPWNTEDIDTDAFHAADSTLITIKVAGTYIMGIASRAEVKGGDVIVRLLENDSTVIMENISPGTAFPAAGAGSIIRNFATTGDTITPVFFSRVTTEVLTTVGLLFWGYRISD